MSGKTTFVYLGPVVVNLFLFAVRAKGCKVDPCRPASALLQAVQLLGVQLDVDLLLLLQELVQDVGMVPDLAAHSEGFERVRYTPKQVRVQRASTNKTGLYYSNST